MDVGFREILLILVIFMVLFDPKRVPEMMKGLGQGVKEFEKAAREVDADDPPKPRA